jgi:hypothetical protein
MPLLSRVICIFLRSFFKLREEDAHTSAILHGIPSYNVLAVDVAFDMIHSGRGPDGLVRRYTYSVGSHFDLRMVVAEDTDSLTETR